MPIDPKRGADEAVRVVVRMRPFNEREDRLKCVKVLDVDTEDSQITITKPGGDSETDSKTFKFDCVYDWDGTQRLVYDETAMPLVESVLEGYNGTIFAYGQTGCGKTYTMEGFPEPKELRGIIPNAFEHIFETVDAQSSERKYLVRSQYLEIYNEEIRDLLGPNPTAKLDLKEDPQRGVFVKDLTTGIVKSAAEIDAVMKAGNVNRTTGATLMNAVSSRSHSIFTVIVETSETVEGVKAKKEDGKGAHIRVGKLNLVDLAGSERQGKTQATGQRFKEATKINLSLSALGNVISALVDGRSTHIPYRDSKLTRLLQDSLGGNTKTVMIATISPADNNYDETLSTLRYANRAKNIKNKPHINEDPKDALLREFQEEIERLRNMLSAQSRGDTPAIAAPQLIAPVVPEGEGGNQILLTATEIQNQQEEMQQRLKEVDDLQKQKEELESKSSNYLQMAEESREELERRRTELEQKQEVLLKQEQNFEAERSARMEMERRLRSAEEIMNERHNVEKEAQVRIEAGKRLERRRLRRAQLEVKQRRHEEEMMQMEMEYAEEQKAMIEEDLESLKKHLEQTRRVARRLRKRCQVQENEIRDLQGEFEGERAEFLDTIRDQNREAALLEQMVTLFVPPKILKRIQEQARWDEDKQNWHLPASCMPRHQRADLTKVSLPAMDDRSGSTPRERSGSVKLADMGGLVALEGQQRSHSAMPMRGESDRPSSALGVSRRGPPLDPRTAAAVAPPRRGSISSLSGPLLTKAPKGPPRERSDVLSPMPSRSGSQMRTRNTTRSPTALAVRREHSDVESGSRPSSGHSRPPSGRRPDSGRSSGLSDLSDAPPL